MKIDSKGLRCSCCFLDGFAAQIPSVADGLAPGPTAHVFNQSF